MQSYTIDGLVVMPPITFEYALDTTVNLLHQTLSFEQGISFEYHNALHSTNDTTFNKYSNFYLTDNYVNTDILEIEQLPHEYPYVNSTFLAFNRLDHDPLSALTANSTCLTSFSAASALSAVDTVTMYMTVQDDVSVNDDAAEYRLPGAERFMDIKTGDTMYQKYYFTIMYINASECLIYHQDGDSRWYLSHKDEPFETFKFVKINHEYGLDYNVNQLIDDGGEKIIFQYARYSDNNLLRIFKTYNNSAHVLKVLTDEERQLQPDAVPIQLVDMLDDDNDMDTPGPSLLELTNDTTIRVRPPHKNVQLNNIDSKTVKYRQSINTNHLDTLSRYTPSEKSNNALHSEYYYLTGESLPINLFPLKNTQTAAGICNSNNISDDNTPNNHRLYNKISTGGDQLHGSADIEFDYSTTTVMYTFSPGMNYFNTPTDMSPFKKLNINDSTLYRSGAIAAHHPAMSDKMYKKRANYSKTTRWGDPADIHTGTWLCTWLSGNDDPGVAPVWMDRYYEPSNVGYVDALTSKTDHVYSQFEIGEVYEHPSEDPNNTLLTGTTAITAVTGNDVNPVIPNTRVTSTGNVYDEPSKLTFEPGCHYAYYRVHDVDIQNNMSLYDPYNLNSSVDQFETVNQQQLPIVDNTLNLTGDAVGKIMKLSDDVDMEQLSIDFDIKFSDIRQPSGHQIVGNCTNSGLGFFNDNNVSPFIVIPASDGAIVNGKRQGSSIRIYDNKYKLYNYVTNDSFITADEAPALFKTIVIRELCEDIFCIMSNGLILQLTHDGVVTSSYTSWSDYYSQISGSEIVDVTYDDRCIYILTHVNSTSYVDVFDMVNKSFKRFDSQCIVTIEPPIEFSNYSISKDQSYGIHIDTSAPPNKIFIKDDPAPFHETRTLYLGYGDQLKAGKRILWFLVTGETSTTTGSQQKHDAIYGYDTKSMKLLPGKITDNGLAEPGILLEIIDYAVDSNDSIWVCHNTNYVSKFDSSRKLLSSQQIDEQLILSMVINRDYNDIGDVEEQAVILSKTIGEEEIQLQIGPTPHPTNDPSGDDFRKASPWLDTVLEVGEKVRYGLDNATIEQVNYNVAGDVSTLDILLETGEQLTVSPGEVNDYRNTRPDTIVYDAAIDSTEVIYPFVDGNNRFGVQIENRHNISSTDVAGKVTDGDYQSITEGFDFIVTEVKDEMYGNIFDITTGKQITVRQLTDFVIDDANDKPQLQNHYEYSLQNYSQYPKHNFNLKLFLQPLFKAASPEVVKLKIDLDNMKSDDQPYTDFIHITLNINNQTGRVELWVNGKLDENVHVYNFPPHKYRFITLLNKNILVGTSPFLQDTILNNKLNNQLTYNTKDVIIRDLNIYNKCVDYHHQLNILRKRTPVGTMSWDIPSGSRNYIDTVDKVFNHSIPPRKSNTFNLVIKNSKIQSAEVQQYITNKLNDVINTVVPAGTNVKHISWTNELVETSD